MGCIEYVNGPFQQLQWLGAHGPYFNGNKSTIVISASGVEVKRIKDSSTISLQTPSEGSSFITTWGFFVAIMLRGEADAEGSANFEIWLINMSGTPLAKKKILSVTAPVNPEPFLYASPGNLGAILTYVRVGNKITSINLFNSDTGDLILHLNDITPAPKNGISAFFSSGDIEIRDADNKSLIPKTKIPQGICQIVQPEFPDVVTPTGNVSNATATINNIGGNCLTITNIPNSDHFSLVNVFFPITLEQGKSVELKIKFDPADETGSFSEPLVLEPKPAEGDSVILCKARTCEALPVIFLPDMQPIEMGSVQQGFRTVRAFTVKNTGTDILTFSAQIVEDSAGLFGLLQDNTVSVTAPTKDFKDQPILPVNPCGIISAGPGEFVFGIAFFADGVTGEKNAKLEIFKHNDKTPGTAAEFIVELSAVIEKPKAVDCELVIDRSGSMAEKSGSRKKMETALDAAKLFIQLSRSDASDRIGLISFNEVPSLAASIDKITAVSKVNLIAKLNGFAPGGATSIAGGIITATKDLAAKPPPPTSLVNTVLIVLTDGMDNAPYPADGKKYSLLGPNGPSGIPGTEAVPIPQETKIYGIGIGDQIDGNALSYLSNSSTGAYLHTKEFSGPDYFNLEKHFTQIFMEAAKYEIISDPVFEIRAGETHTFEFEVLTGDKSVMIVIYDRAEARLPFSVVTANGETIDLKTGSAGYQLRPGLSPTARFLEINVPQGEPERYAGTWKVLVRHDRKACTTKGISGYDVDLRQFDADFQPLDCQEYEEPVIYGIAYGVTSNFAMSAFVTPEPVKTGEPVLLTANVTEFGLSVSGSSVNVTALRPDGSVSKHALYDDRAHGGNVADDGIYGLNYPDTTMPGTYTFTFSASGMAREGKIVKRELVRSKYVEGDGSTQSGGDSLGGDCCKKIIYLLWSVLVLLLILIVLVILLLLYR